MGLHARKSEGLVHSLTVSTFNPTGRFRRTPLSEFALASSAWSLVVCAALLAVVGSVPVAAQAVQFFGSFNSYSQGEASNAQGLVANASGNLYISGSSALAYVPVDANGNPLGTGQQDIYVGGTKVNSSAPPYSTADAMGLAIDATGNLFRVDPAGPLVQMFIYGGDPVNFTYKPLGSGWVEPSSVTVDSGGTVYVLDAGAGTIVELSPTGGNNYSQSTLVTDARLVNTTGLSIDNLGNFYVASGSNYGFYSLVASPFPDGGVQDHQ